MNLLKSLDLRTIISVLAFFLSLGNTLWLCCVNRLRLRVTFKAITQVDTLQDKPLLINMAIANRSRLSVSISRMILYIDGHAIDFSWNTIFVYTDQISVGHESVADYTKRSVEIPVTIPSLGIIGGKFLIELNNPQEIQKDSLESASLKLEVHTNRGKRSFKLR